MSALLSELRRVADVRLQVDPRPSRQSVEAAQEDLELYAYVAAVMSEDN